MSTFPVIPRSLIAGVAIAAALLTSRPHELNAADTNACDFEGSWRATYAWEGGESSGPIIVTVNGDSFLGETAGTNGEPERTETIRGTIDDGAIAGAAVLHGRRGWVPALFNTDDDCTAITLTLPDATVTLTR
jgi:hypothetical protein